MRPPSLNAHDFKRALGTRPVVKTDHFVLHHLPHQEAPSSPTSALFVLDAAPEGEISGGAEGKLSTAQQGQEPVPVDDSVWASAFSRARLGLVLPKKLARRSVTRSLLRHQARESVRRHADAVANAGWALRQADEAWVLRLRAPFDRQQFPSASSSALKRAVRLELDELWAKLCTRSVRSTSPRSG